jgi:hypothetical protein
MQPETHTTQHYTTENTHQWASRTRTGRHTSLSMTQTRRNPEPQAQAGSRLTLASLAAYALRPPVRRHMPII